tara:strand:+ start:114 stop:1718 length:1605 start_codon:yes stop_codon:yes gene_type:complete
MGIFKKIGKGIKKVFKKIGKAIKKQFKRFGKFMNKIGIVGQIAMAFILPGIGNALMSSIGGAFTKMVGQTAAQAGASAAATKASALATAGGATASQAAAEAAKAAAAAKAAGTLGTATGMMASKSALVRGAGSVLQAASNFVGTGVKAFKTVTEGVSSFIGEFSKVALNKIPGVDIRSAAPTMADAWKNVQNSVMKNTSDTIAAFNKTLGIDPVKGATEFGMAGFQVPKRTSLVSQGVTPDLNLTGQPDLGLTPSGQNVLDLRNPKQTSLLETKADIGGFTPTTGKPSDVLDPTKFSQKELDAYDLFQKREAERTAARMTVQDQQGQLVKTSGTPPPPPQSLLGKPDQAELDIDKFVNSDYFKTYFSTNQTKDAIAYKFGDMNAYITPEQFVKAPDINLFKDFQVQAPPSKPGFFQQIGQNIKDIPKTVKTSILEAPQKLADVPGQFVDNLTSTVTGLPAAAAKAALNRAPDQTVNQYQFVASPIPENTYALNQAQMGSTDVGSISAYQNKAASGNVFGSPAFDSYDQYFKLVS